MSDNTIPAVAVIEIGSEDVCEVIPYDADKPHHRDIVAGLLRSRWYGGGRDVRVRIVAAEVHLGETLSEERK